MKTAVDQIVDVKPVVSVIIPAYNVASCIDETLCALENQTLREIEIICVDDGSTDNTLEIIRQHEIKDGRIRAVHQENVGAGAARNAGFDLSRGVWVAFLDADDIYKPNFLSKMVDAATTGDADLAVCEIDAYIETDGVTKPWFRFPSTVDGSLIVTSEYSDCLFQICNPVPFDKLFKSDFVRNQGLRFQCIPNSNDIFFTYAAMASAARMALIREPLVSYRIADGFSIQNDFFRNPTMDKCLCTKTALSGIWEFCIEHNLKGSISKCSIDCLFINLSFAALTKALGNQELLEDVFDVYQHALVDDWHVSRLPKTSSYEDRLKYELMVNSSADQFAWIYKQAGKSRSGGMVRKALLGAKTAIVVAQNKLRGKN